MDKGMGTRDFTIPVSPFLCPIQKFFRRTHKTLLLPATSVLHSQCVIRIAGKVVHNAGFRT
jgi:hypothetical protein